MTTPSCRIFLLRLLAASHARPFLLLAALAAALAACSAASSPEDDGDAGGLEGSCEPGQQSSCLCGGDWDSPGSRTCLPDGSGWSACSCKEGLEGEGEGDLEGQGEGEGEGGGEGGEEGEGEDGGGEGEGEGGPGPGDFRAPCQRGIDCRSGWCVESDEGQVCSRLCNDDCPMGWRCRNVAGTGGDVTFICLPNRSSLCRPCEEDTDCEGVSSRCLLIGQGRYCGRECQPDYPCPDGFVCSTVFSVAGEPLGTQCKPNDGTCGFCEDNDGDGYGVGPDCLGSDCLDSDPTVFEGALEVCDGKDNNCNYQVDEGLTPGPQDGSCPTEGVCAGRALVCRDARWQCDFPANYEPVEASCDDVDNDCDGRTDEDLTRRCMTACGEGTERCMSGTWVNCNAPPALPEVCGDGIDNDCRGGDERRPDGYEPNNSCASCAFLGEDIEQTYTPTFDSVDDRVDYYCFDGVDNFSAFWDLETIKVEIQSLPPGLTVNIALYRDTNACNINNSLDSRNNCSGPCSFEWEESNGGDDDSTYIIKVEKVGEFFGCDAQYRLFIKGLK